MVAALQQFRLTLPISLVQNMLEEFTGSYLQLGPQTGVLGPVAITQLRQNSVDSAINDLVSKISPEKIYRNLWGFHRKFITFGSRKKQSRYLI